MRSKAGSAIGPPPDVIVDLEGHKEASELESDFCEESQTSLQERRAYDSSARRLSFRNRPSSRDVIRPLA